ncbi:hypothetical protein [Leuconostoc carnosum]|uniref:hypothetical protein n=1 Tax=Leuconostoc carnosum TaxID=1252 RepID=UPI00345CC7F9
MDNFKIENYSEQLGKDLRLFDRLHLLIDTLGTTENLIEILDVLQKILDFDSHQSKMVRIDNPFWFPDTHWVTLAFAKFAMSASLSTTVVTLPQAQKVVELHFEEWPNASFRFTKAPLAAGGYYLEETAQNLRVLYWDVVRRRFYLDAQQFATLVQTEALQIAGVEALATFQKRLTAIAEQLADADYDIVLPGSDAANQGNLVMTQKDLSADILDALFVSAAKQQFILKRIQNEQTGAEIAVGDVIIKLLQQRVDGGHAQWHYDIVDDHQKVTIYTLLQQLPFFYRWYMGNLNIVALKDKREVFVD